MAQSKPPRLLNRWHKENLVTDRTRDFYTKPAKRIPPDKTTVEVRMDAGYIICKVCKKKAILPKAPFNYYESGDYRHKPHPELTEAIQNFKKHYCL